MLLVLSPAKTLDFESPIRAKETTEHLFRGETQELVEILRKMPAEDIGKLMKVSDKLATLNYERYQSFDTSYTVENSRPSIEAFQGDVYVGLDSKSLSEDELNYAQQHVRILSGLYGILKPLDVMQPYRLEMGTKLENAHGTNLYKFWGSKISESLNNELEVHANETLINLASNEYFKAIDKKALNYPIVDIHFREERDGKLKVIAFNAKKARGMMARYIVQNRIDTIEGIKAFAEANYLFSDELSTENSLLFIR